VTGRAEPSWRDGVFKRRGTLLALPAISLAVFGKPSAASIALGVPIALAGEALRCWAVGYSGVTTRSDRVVAPQLTTAGPYAYVRNPLYVGNFITALGFTIAFTGGMSTRERALLAALGLGSMLAVYAAIVPLEEAYLRQTFGSDFESYEARVRRVVPRATPAQPQAGSYDPSVIAKAETRTFVTFGAMLAALAVKAVVR
jgi:protein-S-isoprenylcysteine O-methyltransferase Ste14